MTEPVNLHTLSKGELDSFLKSFDHVFSDCDGVVWQQSPLPGASDFFSLMEKLGKSVHFVSNNSIRSKENYESSFERSGIKNGYDRLTIPSTAIAEYLKSINFDKHVYCVATFECVKTLEKNGIKCKYGPDVCPDYYGDYQQFLDDDPDIGAVVFDSDYKVNIPKLYKAGAYLKRPDVLFINGASDKYLPYKQGLALGTGIFTEIIANEAKRQPILLGKPGKLFGEFAMRKAGVTNPGRVLFIGDMIEQDVRLGKATGFNTLLLHTHCTTQQMLEHEIKPDYYANSLGDIAEQLKKLY